MRKSLLVVGMAVFLSLGCEQNNSQENFLNTSAEVFLPEAGDPTVDRISNRAALEIADFDFNTDFELEVLFTCNESQQEIYFSGMGLLPDIQSYICNSSTEVQSVVLTLDTGIETGAVNPITVSSENLESGVSVESKTFNLPIDHKAPMVSIVSEADIKLGGTARFYVEVEDLNIDLATLNLLPSSGVITSQECIAASCVVEVEGASLGQLQLLLPLGGVFDLAGNSNAIEVSEELTVFSAFDLAQID